MLGFVWIGVGGMLGACSRYYLGYWISKRYRSSFPWATWTINITGSFLLGLLASYTYSGHVHELIWKGCGIGFLGAYTTFSTFGFETISLIEHKKSLQAALYVLSSVIIGIVFAAVGLQVGNLLK